MSYVTKYITKCDTPEADLHQISDEIKKYRLFQRFGTWHAFHLPKVKPKHSCDECGCEDWISEFQINAASRAP